MSSRSRLTISLSLFLSSFMFVPQVLPDDSVSTVIQGIRDRYRNAAGITAQYTREAINKTMAMLGAADRQDIAQGRLYFKPPHSLRLEQITPQEELLLTDGQTLWWYLPLKKEAYRYPAAKFGHELRLLSDILMGLRDTGDNFQITLKPYSEIDTYHLLLNPDPPWIDIDHLEVIVLREDFAIKQVEIHNTVGGLSRFILSGWQETAQFNNGFFSFSPPQGTKIIEK
ncbi:MAG: outer membrane lipoprotein carrier protein LolA [Deltaproteobacteria bacterium]|nr:outer membrane lipoprotein carrier protein LolA [Deltaproteobacteria bacterium]MBW2340375.1 outer membrane lipoprotein carrier protein LolA [Deltaproteobacteria bacterium]